MPEPQDKVTRLVLIYPNGTQVGLNGRLIEGEGSLDLTSIHNSNAASPIIAEIHQQCSLGSWHAVGRVALPCWDG